MRYGDSSRSRRFGDGPQAKFLAHYRAARFACRQLGTDRSLAVDSAINSYREASAKTAGIKPKANIRSFTDEELVMLYAIALRVATNVFGQIDCFSHSAHDIAQEAVIAILLRSNDIFNARAMISRMAFNKAISALRSIRKLKRTAFEDKFESQFPSPEQMAETEERKLFANVLVNRLCEAGFENEVQVLLSNLDGTSFTQLAQERQIPVSTLRSRQAKMRRFASSIYPQDNFLI